MVFGLISCAILLANLIQVANLPAEITHLMEEIQAKDMLLQQCKDTINRHDGSLQKFVKLSGGHIKNPKEDSYTQIIRDNYDKAEILQAEKIGLSEKAVILVSIPAQISHWFNLLTCPID